MRNIGFAPMRILSDYEQQQEYIGEKVFTAVQACWWYAIYAPEFGDWSEKEAREFTLKMNEVNDMLVASKQKEYINGMRQKDILMQGFIEESGIDYAKIANEIPYAVKIRMFGKKFKPTDQDKTIFAFQMNDAVREAMFLPLYTLWNKYNMSKDDIEKYIDYFMVVANEFKGGLNDKIIIRYFEEIEHIPVNE